MRGDKVRLEEVAGRLAVSPRRLQYRLKEEGTSFSGLLETARMDIAKSYLGRPEVPISDIAFMLGFSEQSGFNHAFRRWTGVTPKEFRKKIDAWSGKKG